MTAASREERGAATVLVVAMIGVLLLVGAALGVVAAIVHAHRQAQNAADLAALAGAKALADGADGCVASGVIAAANGARLASCLLDGRDVRITVEITGPRWLGQTADVTAEARAGPASSAG